MKTSEIKFKVADSKGFSNIELAGVKFLKADNEVIAIYEKSKVKFDDIINVVKKNAEIIDISTDDGDLEDIFIKLTNN